MKRITFIILLCFSVGQSFAQDTITKNNSEIIIAKITEINPTEVHYKKFNLQDGPTYIDKKSDIKMIVYSNGRKEILIEEQQQTETPTPADNLDYYGDNSNGTNKIGMWKNGKFRQKNVRLNEKQVLNIFMQTNDPKLIELANRSKKAHGLQFIGFAAFPIALGTLYLCGEAGNDLGEVIPIAVVGLVATVACPIASARYKKKRNEYNTQAIKLYNQKF